MSTADLEIRLDQLRQSIKQTADLIEKLAQSRSGEEASQGSASDIAADVRESLQEEENELGLIKEDLEDISTFTPQGSYRRSEKLRKGSRGGELHDDVQQLTVEISVLRSRFRSAHLQAKKNEEIAIQMDQETYLADLRAAADAMGNPSTDQATDQNMSHSEMRTSLFSTRRTGPKNTNNPTKDDLLLTASSDLTSSLRRTHELLASELSRSRFAHDTLEASNAALKELNENYGTLDNLLTQSRGLLGSLLRSQKSDTWYLETAIYVLLGTISWLLFRRLLYGPLWWLLYLPLKFAWSIIALVVRSGTGRGSLKSIDVAFQSNSITPIIAQRSVTGGAATVSNGMAGFIQAQAGPPSANAMNERDTPYSLSQQILDIVENTGTRTGSSLHAAATPDTEDVTRNEVQSGEYGQPEGDEVKDNQQRPSEAEDGSSGSGNVLRGDGTVLRERDEATEPRNPKKRMFEEPPVKRKSKDEL